MNKVSGILIRSITILIFVACLIPYVAQGQFAEDALRFSDRKSVV